MSLQSTTVRVSYSGNGATVDFSFPYYFIAEADLTVMLVDTDDQSETLQTLTTHYTIAGEGDPSGGTVTFLTAPAADKKVVIIREPDITQTFDPEATGPVPPDTIERELDRRTMVEQYIAYLVDRGIRLPDGYTAAFDTSIPVDFAADEIIAINSAGTGITTLTMDELSILIAGLPDTDSLPEGVTNLYFTTARAVAAITGGASTIATADLTASRALISNASGKVAVSAVTDTELGYVSGVTSAIQTQLDAKALASDLTAHLGDTTDAHDASAISVTPTGNLAADDVQEGLQEHQGDIDDLESALPSGDDYLQLQEQGAAIAPAAGYRRFLAATDGRLHAIDSSGNDWVVGVDSIANDNSAAGNVTSTYKTIILTNAARTQLTDIVAGLHGQPIVVINRTGAAIEVTDQNGGTAANEIITGTGGSLTLEDDAAISLVYDTDVDKWQVIGGTGSGSGGGGGGGIEVDWFPISNAPILSVLDYAQVYEFEDALDQSLYFDFRVPDGYAPGSPLGLKGHFRTSVTSGTVLFTAVVTLLRTGTDAADDTTNQHTSVNAAITVNGTANVVTEVNIDLSEADGQVNGVAISPGDRLLVLMYRDTATDTAAASVYAFKKGWEVTLD